MRTPLKPAMGVSMIGKQRRTPGIMSPRDLFFASPPSSPTLASVPSSTSPHQGNKTPVPPKLRNQKILPHYPGMEYPPVFEPGSYSLCGSPADQTMSPGDHDQDGGSEGRSGMEGHVVFTVAQVGMTHSVPHMSHKLMSSPETPPSRASQEQHSSSAREYHLSQRSTEVSGYGGSGGAGGPLSPPASVRQHALHILVTAQTTPRTVHASDSPQSIYVSAPVSGSTSHHQNITTSSSHSVATHHQCLYVTTPVRPSTQQNINVSQPSTSSTPLKKHSTGGGGRTVSQYAFGSPSQTTTRPSPENKASQPTKPQRSSMSLTPSKPHLPTPPNSSPSNKDTGDNQRE